MEPGILVMGHFFLLVIYLFLFSLLSLLHVHIFQLSGE